MLSSPHDPFLIAWISGASALLGALAGSLLSGYFTLRAKQNEYLNDFYKIVITERVEAYERVEALIQSYKSTVVDELNEPYHCSFAVERQHRDSLIRMGAAMDSGLWLSDEIFDAIQKINYLQYRIPEDPNERIRFGKQHYVEIANMRESLEKMLTLDMLDLHKVRQFLKAKCKRSRGFQYVNLRPNEDK
jgi:hypothetical protein